MVYIKNFTYSIPYFGTGNIKTDIKKIASNLKIQKQKNIKNLYLLMFGNYSIDVYSKTSYKNPEVSISDLIKNENYSYLDNFINQIMKNYPNTVEVLSNNLELLKNAKALNDLKTLEEVYLRTLADIKDLTNQTFVLDPLGGE